MKRRAASTQKPEIKVTVSETTWKVLAEVAASPKELLIFLCRVVPAQVRTRPVADLQKLLKTITATEIAQIVIRTYLQQSAPLTPAELHSLGEPSKPATLEELLARGLMHQQPETYRKVLQEDAKAIRKSKPFEKRPKQLLIKLTAVENENFRRFATRMGVGPSDLGGLLIERFAHYFPAYRQESLREQKKDDPPRHA
ncbi:MAG TPA: hypothetical protein VK615_03200 [Candidatus Binatia bacterium]|nr:hypothetical protein [Candidatus Binatia bacterium]